MDFAEPDVRADRLRDVVDGRPVVVLRSFSKSFGLAGLRLGVAIADPAVARLLDVVQEPFNVNRAALAAGRAAVGAATASSQRRRTEVAAARAALRAGLDRRGLESHPSQANFVLVELGVDDGPVCERAARAGASSSAPGTGLGLPGLRAGHGRAGAAHGAGRRDDRRGGRTGEMSMPYVWRTNPCWLLTGSPGCSSARERSTWSGSPRTGCINSAAALGMRPIITRTERVAVNIADGFARATNGERLLPCVTQYGPGTEAAFGAVAQAHGDRSPILLVPDGVRGGRTGRGPELPKRAGVPADHPLRGDRQHARPPGRRRSAAR